MIATKVPELYSLQFGLEAAKSLMPLLAPVCQRIEIAGSVRRRRPQVHDLDLVIWPNCIELPGQQLALFATDCPPIYHPQGLFALCRSLGWGNWGPGDWPGIIRIPTSPMDGLAIGRIPIELYVCEPDGSNFEALLQMRTGSAEYNVRLAKRAIEVGLRYKAGYGVFSGDQRVDDGTERGIFKAMGWEYVEPESRA